jgi:glycosyltransferase involved in cell wall biosynthesis
MARKLDILVPIYNEGEEVVKPLLDSIAIQQGVDLNDVGVIICCDGGSTVISDEFMANYPFHIEFHMCEHQGVSATRNACFGFSEAPFVEWIDCDDMYCDVCALYIIFREIENDFDILLSVFREQTKGPDGELAFINRGDMMKDGIDHVFVHGKIYNASFIRSKGIEFDPRLTCHEDSFHTLLAENMASPDRIKYSPTPFFLWRWRDESVCRHDPETYILSTYGDLISSNDALVDEFLRRMRDDLAKQYCASMVFDAFYLMNKPEWVDRNNRKYRDKVERQFSEYFRKHRELYDSLTEQEKAVISSGVRQRTIMEGMLMEATTVNEWLRQILRKYPAAKNGKAKKKPKKQAPTEQPAEMV